MYQAREFADLAGVTVRTLHHYDRLGLLKPKRRTEAGYRLYEARDLERLEQIAALKYLGLSLKQIRTVLERGPVGLPDALHMQRRLLEEKRKLLDRAIQAICRAETQLQSSDVAGCAVLKNIIEVIEMEANQDWMAKYVTEEARAKIEGRKHLWSPELQERVSRQWNELIAEVEQALGEDPASEKAQALAARWNRLVEEFTGRDKDIEQSVANMWADRKNWPAHMEQKAPVIKPQVWDFIARANAVSGYSCR
jgi:DNA-binding transcriptional MerR regulator